ncbi:MAG TPA: FtsX-like permease family protein [Pyrinomonadaceae bacterium]|nr:FtsX-like permease family protein [Pyrinomonadaceae bacterium]
MLALKLFRRGSRRGLARFTSIAAIAGITLGVASLLFALALSRGFQLEMHRALLASTPHISIFPSDGKSFQNWEQARESIRAIRGVREATPQTEIPGAIISDTGTHIALLQVSSDQVGTAEAVGVTLGVELAARAGLEVGMTTTLLIARGSENVATSEVIIAGIERTGNFDADLRMIRADPADIARLTGEDEFVPDSLAVRLHDPLESESAAAAIRELVGSRYRVVDWQEANRPLFAALTLERRAAFIIIGLIIAVAVLNITTTLALLVAERRLDIAVLRTCGARGRELAGIFVVEGLILGMAGLVIGGVLGLGAIAFSNYFGVINLDPEVYAVGRIVLETRVYDLAWIAAAVLGLSIAATLYPAITAARLKPMENLRNN